MKEAIAKAPSGRPKRLRVGMQDRLTVDNKEPGFEYRWVLAKKPGRVEMFERAGYEVVSLQDAQAGTQRLSSGSHVDNVNDMGGGDTAVLMRIPTEFYNEDQAIKARQHDEMERGVLTPNAELGQYGEAQTTVISNK